MPLLDAPPQLESGRGAHLGTGRIDLQQGASEVGRVTPGEAKP